MNRRDFFKFAGKGVAALGVVAVTGLPDIDEVKEEVEWEFNVPKYDKDAEIIIPELADFWPVAGDPKGNEFPGLAEIIRDSEEKLKPWLDDHHQDLRDKVNYVTTHIDDRPIYVGSTYIDMPDDLDFDGMLRWITATDNAAWSSLDD